ncbi:aspartyl/asparaginyl beta-hydroxylase domain-containing protein [Amycolatopsis alba]|uniref:Aspartyl beta-hydroxylase n=1 Tax=Amycolatopsis alba DSM 44262 TaxID=1125972 RepID=A0A229RSS7_AMYAL|nr:aspartyl/asparaginyl beta-hydroxylase domain-containing protein [Amycolatopsis alba]OXM49720.1 aspartyl beta-hydroxylase [Amycolatopsis alba DSM 44262]
MQTQTLGNIDIDRQRVDRELATTDGFGFAEQYGEFQSGLPWKSCMLWAVGGEVGDGVIAHYDRTLPCVPTEYGTQLDYLNELITRSFNTEHMLFARLVLMTDNVLIPHRDFVEFVEDPIEARAAHRFHIPLATDETCLFMDDRTIYRMPVGQVWSLDVTHLHSAAVLSDTRRYHLILDFADAPGQADLFAFPATASGGIPAENTVERPKITEDEREALHNLSGVLSMDTLSQVAGIVVRTEYRKDGGEDFSWRTITEIARRGGDTEVMDHLAKLREHCTLRRGE